MGVHVEDESVSYHVIDPDDLDQVDDRPVDVRSITGAAGLGRGAPLSIRRYEASPGQQLPLDYHYHDEQVEAFVVLSGTLSVETPERVYEVGAGRTFLVEPGNPHRSYVADDATGPVRVLAVGAPSVDDVHAYDPEEGG